MFLLETFRIISLDPTHGNFVVCKKCLNKYVNKIKKRNTIYTQMHKNIKPIREQTLEFRFKQTLIVPEGKSVSHL